jgi:predicted HicB family RNase H-like nuclease
MKELDDFDGYSVILLQREGEWVVHFSELPNVAAFGQTIEDALDDLHENWQYIKEDYRRFREPLPAAPSRREYSGRFSVRIDRRVHRALAIEAAQAGVTLNALVTYKLSNSADHLKYPTRAERELPYSPMV